MIRVVLDPGVFISALIGPRGGPPDIVVRAFAEDRIAVVASPFLLAELERVLRRPKFDRYLDQRTTSEFIKRLQRHAEILEDPTDRPAATRDRNDDYLVSLALQAGVEAIVSGDRDLLEADLAHPPVWTPRHFADQIRA